jgi:nucleoside-diphosphate kinase
MEQTLSIIKPDAVKKNKIGEILARFEKAGLKVVAAKMVHLNVDQAKSFYNVHAARPFFMDLVTFMSEGPVFVSVLEGKDAVAQNRAIMGATNPKDAAPGTIRKDFAESIDRNAVHGSDSLENAKQEINFFFDRREIQSDACPTSSCCCC